MSVTDSPSRTATGRSDAAELTGYRAPIAEMQVALQVAGLAEILTFPTFSHVDQESVELAITEFGRFAGNVIAPTDRIGDAEGSHLDQSNGVVRTPAAFQDAYRQYVASGWGALPFPSIAGGEGFPSLVGFALQEMFTSANLALSLNPVLTQSAIELIVAWGSELQRSLYLPKLLTGEWSGTMNLTEPEAGSDLGEVRTKATKHADGTWRVSGTKIFITWGEHDLTDNIIHLVLARTPGSPPGTKGLSLFLVPKVLVGSEGTLGRRNALRCIRTEDKLGIHGSPTCVMEYDEAVGELVGDECGGIRAMFTMMNAARLSIGLQGPAVAERAYQQAYGYAQSRIQGRATGVESPRCSPIIEHPDVRRMLLDMRTSALAGRLLLYTATGYRDVVRYSPDESARATAHAYLDLLTPVAKAWSTDIGVEAASTGVQILGGAGFLEESGMAQRLRDSRIAPIYEGTNGIQAIDLVMRKLPRDNGRWIRQLLDDMALIADNGTIAELKGSYASLADAVGVLQATTEQLLPRVEQKPQDALAGATSYLEMMGLTLGGWLMTRRAEIMLVDGATEASRAIGESEFFATERTARAYGLAKPVLAGADRLADL